VLNILVVDAEAEVRLLFFIASDELNCETLFAATGEEALDVWFEHDDIGLILLSAELPDIDACTLADRLRKTERGNRAAIVFLSHSEDTELLVKLLRHGDDVVIKPFSQAVLLAKLLAMQRTRKLYLQIDEHNRELEQFRRQTEAEVQIATDVFSYINAQNLPAVPGVSTFLSAFSSFSGDLLLMSPRPGEGFNVLIADITGHGLPAALGTIPIAENFFTMTSKGFGVGDIAREMNKVFRKRMPDYLLCAAVLIAVQDKGRRLQIWSGGMPAQIVFDEKGRAESFIKSRHMALGALTDAEFDHSVISVDLRRGQQILCFTDGVTETINARNELFGEENLLQAIESSTADEGIIDCIIDALDRFVEGGRLSDDVTIFCFDNTEYSGIPRLAADSKNIAEVDGFHWRTKFQLAPPQLRDEHPLELIFSALPAHPIVRAARADIAFIINELFVNALDHGLLHLASSIKEQEEGLLIYFSQREERLAGLNSGKIDIEIRCDVMAGVGVFRICCRDSGEGFDFAATLKHAQDDSHHSGRGLRTIAAMCDSLDANSAGNAITALYRWPRPAITAN
jgi:serine phosphatase RsbU (regulator of sigma subunit)/anti-sigma regulatory factor (Ser/Thr protein kinase)